MHMDLIFKHKLINEVGKFCCAWACFEKYYFNSRCNCEIISNSNFDRNINLPNQLIIDIKHEASLRNWNNIVQDLNIRDQEIANGWVNEIEEFLRNNHNFSIKAIVMICYRVRNNLFHGNKKFDSSINLQANLFKSLKNFLKQFLKEVNEINMMICSQNF